MNYEADIAYLEHIDIAILSSVNLWCRISTILKQKVIDKAQSFGSFYDANGEKYCAISVLSKYLG